jgi:uncharacterized membrane protein YgaE (UPF0421/DUF939 family)
VRFRSVVPVDPLDDALRVGSGGIGSVRTVVRIAVAVTVSYELAAQLHRNDLLLMAPVTTLFVIQGSPFATVGSSLQRMLGTCLGVVIATLYLDVVSLNALTFGVAMVAALLVARSLPIGLTGQMQVASGTLYVLVLGGSASSNGFWRVADVIIGGLIGIVAVYVFPQRPRVGPAELAIDTLSRSQTAQLRRVANEIGTVADPLPATGLHKFNSSSVALGELEATARNTLSAASESVRFRASERGAERTIEQLSARMARVASLNAQIRAISGAADRLYDRESYAPALSPSVASELLASCADLIESTDNEPEATSQLAAAAREQIAGALTEATQGGVSVTHVLESVSLLGRLELLIDTAVPNLSDTDTPDDGADSQR